MAVATFIPVSDHYSFLKRCNSKEWDFFATAASVQAALLDLAQRVSGKRFKALHALIVSELHKWHPRGAEAVLDCQGFTHGNLDMQSPVVKDLLPSDTLGLWVLWNLLQRKPTFEEAQAARGIGSALATPLHDWWTRG
ncbi:hypothetical protein [Methyloceanibacter methanicus]|uniref:hypothetical protein n=1 Tax=Methyloceanibacter methanicus TaxID=1774968 RepID=UPI00114D32C6|nr:hypothetical protein [Methyloceanibacter methanicus]